VRTLAYQRAIQAGVKRGDVVLDLGCGSGILSLCAARAGARKVYAVDRSKVIEQAREAARRNGLDRRIEFIQDDLRRFTLRERVDVIVHELIGGSFWDERMVQIVSRARDRQLGQGGRLIPWAMDLMLAPTSYESPLETMLQFWASRPYGFDLGHFGALAFRQEIDQARRPFVIKLDDGSSFLAPPRFVHRVDLRSASRLPRRVEASFAVRRGGVFGGLCAFVRVHLDRRRSFSTDPRRPATHWGQLFLPAHQLQRLRKGDRIGVTLHPRVRSGNWRWSVELS
jgi:SAM-dependent methyltransferase